MRPPSVAEPSEAIPPWGSDREAGCEARIPAAAARHPDYLYRDARLGDTIDLLRRKRRPDGTWLLQHTHPGRTFFKLEANGQPSRRNTLRALRVLRWWETA